MLQWLPRLRLVLYDDVCLLDATGSHLVHPVRCFSAAARAGVLPDLPTPQILLHDRLLAELVPHVFRVPPLVGCSATARPAASSMNSGGACSAHFCNLLHYC